MKRRRFVRVQTGPLIRLGVSGQSLVEFALVVPLFFMLVFGIVDFGRLFFTQMTLQHAMREAGRFGVTGNHLTDPNDASQMLSRVASIKEVVKKSSMGLGVDLNQVNVTSPQGGTTVPAGGPGQTFTVSLTYTLHLFTPIIGQFFNNGEYVFTVSTTFKNEPFNAGKAI